MPPSSNAVWRAAASHAAGALEDGTTVTRDVVGDEAAATTTAYTDARSTRRWAP